MGDDLGPDQVAVVPGDIRVECRPVLSMRCPRCHREHSHLLGPDDHVALPGTHYWRVDCSGERFAAAIEQDALVRAVARALSISTLHRLSDEWLG